MESGTESEHGTMKNRMSMKQRRPDGHDIMRPGKSQFPATESRTTEANKVGDTKRGTGHDVSNDEEGRKLGWGDETALH
eukprot:CAMPEP_0206525546 /NCGR_PEP_ID=MMETSP0325_2-20121206/60_1 /ASSEMBLY_ACC=CAM_ASM_000347 /TAXON_ID=2866 /ORGANISM="Crypthecodinium cohnii, Strain Seligo" /LENGTH=78 /DNA_ID=CAMNT_0054020271 /DNA_START=33 /DNA_END=266 /DNA_ORIENTATION=+